MGGLLYTFMQHGPQDIQTVHFAIAHLTDPSPTQRTSAIFFRSGIHGQVGCYIHGLRRDSELLTEGGPLTAINARIATLHCRRQHSSRQENFCQSLPSPGHRLLRICATTCCSRVDHHSSLGTWHFRISGTDFTQEHIILFSLELPQHLKQSHCIEEIPALDPLKALIRSPGRPTHERTKL